MIDIHEQLMKKVHEYYKVNQIWEAKRTHVSGLELRKILSEIRHLCSDRRVEIQKIRDQKPKIKSPEYRKSQLNTQGNKTDT